MSALLPNTLNLSALRNDFPLLRANPGLAYLDSAATSQKPQAVLNRMEKFYETENANIHRGVHRLSQVATEAFEKVRRTVQVFLKAKSEKEIIFTKGCTEGINLVSQSWGRANLKSGDEILISTMEHHSNIVPWQLIAEQTGALVRPIPIHDSGEIDLEAFGQMVNSRTKVLALMHVSNALGTINPVKEMVAAVHAVGGIALIDGAQAGPHENIDVVDLDADFYVLSCHKMYAPTGVGVLYGKREILEAMPPYLGGGDMIRTVSFEGTTFAELPAKFEAGTPNIAGVIGLGAAIDYLNALPERFAITDKTGVEIVAEHENRIGAYARQKLAEIEGLTFIGTAAKRTGSIVSFTLKGVHPHDIGTILDHESVAIRTGHHCCMPLMRRYGVPATARASLALYSSEEDIDQLARALIKCKEMFS